MIQHPSWGGNSLGFLPLPTTPAASAEISAILNSICISFGVGFLPVPSQSGALPRQPYFFIAPHKPHDDVLPGAVAAWTDSHVRSPIRTLKLVRVGIGNVARSLCQALAFPAEHGVLNLQPIILSDRALRISVRSL